MTKVLRLGEIAELGAGNSAPQDKKLFAGGKLPFVRTSDVGVIHIGEIESSRDLLTPAGAKGLKLFAAGTILFPKSGASTFLNHRVILKKPSYVSSHLATIKGNSEFALDRYLFYFLQTIDARDLCQDQSYPSLNLDQIANIEVPLPTIQMQVEVIKKLDSAFNEIDLLQEKVALLELLINECDNSLLKNTLDTNFIGQGKSNTATLDEITELITRGISPAYHESANTLVINQRCIRDGRVDPEFARRHDEKAKKVPENKLLQNDDGLINSTGVGTLGRTALFEHPGTGDFTVDSHVTIIRPKSQILDKDYFGIVLKDLENIFISLSSGTSGQTELSREAIKNIAICYPDNLDDQRYLYQYYASLNSELNKLRTNLINRRLLIETLRLSLLSNAFSEVIGLA